MTNSKNCLLEVVILSAVLLAISPSACLAQESSWDAIAQAQGKTVTIVRNDKRSQNGYLEQASSGSLTISAHGSQSLISRDDIRRVYVRGNRSRKLGALWGLALGGGGGAIVGAATYHSCTSTSFCLNVVNRGEITAVGAVVGAAAGSIVGALVGGEHKKTLLFDKDK